MQKNIVIGLTGGIGSGKTTALEIFASLHANTVNADIINKQLLESANNIAIISKKFGKAITQEGKINKALLRKICFNNAQDKLWLENLLHTQIFDIIKQQTSKPCDTYYIVEIPLLFEAKSPIQLTRSCAITCSQQQQLARVFSRSNLSFEETKAIIKTQISNADKIKLANDWIDNSKDLEHLCTQVKKLHDFYLNLTINRAKQL